jgi:hypothetical protein
MPEAIEVVTVWERMPGVARATYAQPTEVAKVKVGRKFQYVVPRGYDYECDYVPGVEILTQAEFDKRFSARVLP